MQSGGPVDTGGRIGELDVIRGFALFGVLWMNLYGMAGYLFPETAVIAVAPPAVDRWVGVASTWLMLGKAQALFSLLFGFGFSLFLARAETSGRQGGSLYLRRVGFLLVIGLAHALLLWPGDILNAYALMGLFLVLTRRWPMWLLLAIGLSLTLFGALIDRLVWEYVITAPGTPLPYRELMEPGALRRMPVYLGHDYLAFVRENWVGLWTELYATTTGLAYLGWIFGRFLLGSWLHRQGWIQNAARHRRGFRIWAAILLPAGLILAGIGPAIELLGLQPTGEAQRVPLHLLSRSAQLVLALGYAAGLVFLLQSPAWRSRLSGLGAAGRMALSNYLMQSMMYVVVLYGFGFGLLRYTSPTVSLVLAAGFFSAQIAFSRWWLRRYRFGPAEWAWRSWTYERWQLLRRVP